ncbi:MAG: hypothetical protein ACYC6G_06180 [Desulfobaccales bacterium]
METKQIWKFLSGGALFFAILHLIRPSLGIDTIFIALLIIAFFPWLLPFLKTLEFPGGVKIEFKDVKEATDKIIKLEGKAEIKTATFGDLTVERGDSFLALRHVSEIDPNLGLVGFRIEIEKRLLALANKNNIDTLRKPLSRIVRELQNRELIPIDVSSGLMDLIGLGNSAAHGAEVSPDAANWVLEMGPSILNSLDKLIEQIDK